MPFPPPSGFFAYRQGWSRGAGWTFHTSPAYPASRPDLSAAATSSVLQIAPRAVLTSHAPFLKCERRSALIRFSVPSCRGALIVMTSH